MDLKEQYEKLLRYCYMLTKDRYLSEDIVQEAYVKFWGSHSYRDSGKELAYLYAIARNLCMDEFRRKKPCDIDEIGEIAGDGKHEPESLLDHLALEAALEKLPGDLREPIVLRYTNEMSVVNIAKILGISRFAVHRRLKEGIKLLKHELGGEEDE